MRLMNHFTGVAKVALLTIPALTLAMQVQALVHPGGLQTQSELTNAREKVAAGVEPWKSAWEALEDTDAQASYKPDVTSHITDQGALQNQGHAAYVLAVKWAVSGDMDYAIAARNIVDTWVDTVDSFEFDNFSLRMGIGSIQMANAAEILATAFDGEAGWSDAKVNKAQDWFRKVIDPTVTTGSQRSSNWGTSALGGAMSIAIFLDDDDKFDDAVYAYKYGFSNTDDGCAHVTDYIWHPSGQNSESGRDQVHPEGGVGHLVETALMAWNQGVNVVSFTDYRLVAGLEYIAEYNLGYEVPWYFGMPDECNVYPSSHEDAISPDDRYEFAPIWEMANKLFNDAGASHPFTEKVIASEGKIDSDINIVSDSDVKEYRYYPSRDQGGSYRPETTTSDNPGMGTLLYTAYSSDFVSMRKGNDIDFAIDGNKDGANRQNVYLWSYGATNKNQHWKEISRGGDYYSYQKRDTNYCLDGGKDGENLQSVYLYKCSTDNQNQHWKKVKIGNNYRLEKRNASDYSIDGSSSAENGQDLYLWESSDTNKNQQWQFDSH